MDGHLRQMIEGFIVDGQRAIEDIFEVFSPPFKNHLFVGDQCVHSFTEERG